MQRGTPWLALGAAVVLAVAFGVLFSTLGILPTGLVVAHAEEGTDSDVLQGQLVEPEPAPKPQPEPTPAPAPPLRILMGSERNPLEPGSVLRLGERDTLKFFVEVTDPDGDPVTLAISGLPQERVSLVQSVKKPNQYSGEINLSSKEHTYAGRHRVSFISTDTTGETASTSFVLDLIPEWEPREEMIYPRPLLEGEGVRRVSVGGGKTLQIVDNRTVNIRLEANHLWHQGSEPVPPQLRYRFFLNAPDERGNNVKTPLGPALQGDQVVPWDASALPNGQYVLTGEILGSGEDLGSDVSRFRARPLFLQKTDDQPADDLPPRFLATAEGEGQRGRWHGATGHFWIASSSLKPPKPRLLNIQIPKPPQTAEEGLAIEGKPMVMRGLFHEWQTRYFPEERLARTSEGHLVVSSSHYRAAAETKSSWRFPFYDGAHQQASMSPISSGVPHPTEKKLYYVSNNGRLSELVLNDPQWGVYLKTLAGWVNPLEVTPYLPSDGDVKRAMVDKNRKLVGEFADGILLDGPKDLVLDPQNPDRIYIADNRRIALAEKKPDGTFRISTFAGNPKSPGQQDGDLKSASFHRPESLEMVGEDLYVVDVGNGLIENDNKIRVIDLKSGQVRTLHLPEVEKLTPAWIRALSPDERDGSIRLLVQVDFRPADPAVSGPTGNLYLVRIDKESGQVLSAKPVLDQSGKSYHLDHFDVDTAGSLGRENGVIASGINGDHGNYRITLLFSGETPEKIPAEIVEIFGDDGGNDRISNHGLAGAGDGGSYSKAITIGEGPTAGAGFINGGNYKANVGIFYPVDTAPVYDRGLASQGRDVYFIGTVPEFAFAPNRSASSALYGRRGYGRLGPTFNDLLDQYPTVSALANYLRNDPATGPKPEVTGRHLLAWIYYVLVFSERSWAGKIDPGEIERELRQMGLYTDDALTPEIREVSVQYKNAEDPTTVIVRWKTNEPAISTVGFGTTRNYGLQSQIEPDYAKEHSVEIAGLLPGKEYYFSPISKDLQGNFEEYHGAFKTTPVLEFTPTPKRAPQPEPPPAPQPTPTVTPTPAPIPTLPPTPSLAFRSPAGGQRFSARAVIPLAFLARHPEGAPACVRLILDGRELTAAELPALNLGSLSLCPSSTPTLMPEPTPTLTPEPSSTLTSEASPTPSPETTPTP